MNVVTARHEGPRNNTGVFAPGTAEILYSPYRVSTPIAPEPLEVLTDSRYYNSDNSFNFVTRSDTPDGALLLLITVEDWGTLAAMPAPTGTAGTWTIRETANLGTNRTHMKLWTRTVTGKAAQTVTVSHQTGNDASDYFAALYVFPSGTDIVNIFARENFAPSGVHTTPSQLATDEKQLVISAWINDWTDAGQNLHDYAAAPGTERSRNRIIGAGNAGATLLTATHVTTRKGATEPQAAPFIGSYSPSIGATIVLDRANIIHTLSTALLDSVPITQDPALDASLVETDEHGRTSRMVDVSGRTWLRLRDDVRVPTSGPDIVCWGDSLTAGAGGNGVTYPNVLASLSKRVVHNAGVGGETSVTIAARAGAKPLVFRLTGGVVPADTTPVQVTLDGINWENPTPLLQGSDRIPGTLYAASATQGLTRVEGILNLTGGKYYFTRAAPGTAVAASRPSSFRSYFSEQHRGDVAIIWIGQNGPNDTRARSDARAIVSHLDRADKRWLVMSRPSTDEPADTTWHDEFAPRFISPRRYLVEFGLADAGITATAQDNTDIAAGRIPTSLRIDSVHFNAAGYTVLANLVWRKMIEMGWL